MPYEQVLYSLASECFKSRNNLYFNKIFEYFPPGQTLLQTYKSSDIQLHGSFSFSPSDRIASIYVVIRIYSSRFSIVLRILYSGNSHLHRWEFPRISHLCRNFVQNKITIYIGNTIKLNTWNIFFTILIRGKYIPRLNCN